MAARAALRSLAKGRWLRRRICRCGMPIAHSRSRHHGKTFVPLTRWSRRKAVMTIRVALIAFSAILCVFATNIGTRLADEIKVVPPSLPLVVLSSLEAEYQVARRYDQGT